MYCNRLKSVLFWIYPYSATVCGHIIRRLYATITMTQLFQETARSLDLMDCGYHNIPIDDYLCPTTCEREMPGPAFTLFAAHANPARLRDAAVKRVVYSATNTVNT